MSHLIDLGQRFFSSQKSELTLFLQASASILLLSEEQSPQFLERVKKLLLSGHIWVSQAAEVKLVVRIVLEFDLHPSFTCFVSRLGDIICKAKMWSDLGLIVLYKSCIFEPGEALSTYILSFGVQKHIGTQVGVKTRNLPRILRDVADASPPADISTARLTSIDVRLSFHRAHKNTMQHSQQESHNKSQGNTVPARFDERIYDDVPYAPGSTSSTDAKNDDLLFGLDFEETNEDCDLSSQAAHKLPVVSELEVLFQDALMTLVFGYAARRRSRNQTGPDGFHSLSSIAPSVFKPGYREAMHQRSRLMPSIAKSLTSMLKHSDNPTLPNKIVSARMVRNLRLDHSALTEENEIKDTLKTRLWTTAQKRLYHAPTPKHWKRSANLFRDENQDEQVQDDNLLKEEMTEDGLTAADLELELFRDDNEAELDNEFHWIETDDGFDSHSMIIEDIHTSHSVQISEDDNIHQFHPPTSVLFPSQDTNPPQSPDTHKSLLSFSEHPESDDEMLDQGPDPIGESLYPEDREHSQPPSQTSFSQSQNLHLYTQPFISSCGNYLSTSQTSFAHSPGLHVKPSSYGVEDGYEDEMFLDIISEIG
ncbi:hypothetical protein BDV18DRAFT_157987 [Aspergillus unguis]